eukprot:312557_1
MGNELGYPCDKIVKGTGNRVAVDTICGIQSVSSSKWLDGRAGETNPLMSQGHRNPVHDGFLQWTFTQIKASNKVAIRIVSSSKWLDGRAGQTDPWMSGSHRNPQHDVFLQWEFVDTWEAEKMEKLRAQRRQQEIDALKKQQQEQHRRLQELQLQRKADLMTQRDELEIKINTTLYINSCYIN